MEAELDIEKRMRLFSAKGTLNSLIRRTGRVISPLEFTITARRPPISDLLIGEENHEFRIFPFRTFIERSPFPSTPFSMCLIAFHWQPQSETPLTLVANRDEFFRRPTAPLARWPDQPDIIAGRDLEGKGTWLGISSATGRFAAVTNIRRPIYRQPFEKSRGRLVSGFLQSALPARRFLETVERERRFFSGFNLLVFDGADLYHLNSEQMPQPVAPGFHGLSNAGLDTSGWPKVDSAGQKLAHWLKKPGSLMDLALLLDSRSLAAPETLPVTGVDPELEHRLSAEFILMDDYGTRCSTGLILKKDEILIAEVSFDSVGRISGQVELLVRCR